LGQLPDWSTLEAFLPGNLLGQELRAAVASTLVASLELARGGGVRLRQDAPFSPILLAPGEA
jgi:segregation and condensation protein A